LPSLRPIGLIGHQIVLGQVKVERIENGLGAAQIATGECNFHSIVMRGLPRRTNHMPSCGFNLRPRSVRDCDGALAWSGTIINIASAVGISPETLNGVYGATKAYVVAFSHSLQHELSGKGIRIQAVLPGATATDLWEIAGLPWQKLPASMVMSPEDMVDAALVGLDQGELVTIPGLHDGDEWTRFEAARRALSQKFRNSTPAPRYGIGLPQSALSTASSLFWRIETGKENLHGQA
jgi:NAD(P)-dependent dehydrogenase (short-subunit alcohol dehydrogenase family)